MAAAVENGHTAAKPVNDENAAPTKTGSEHKIGDTVTVFHDPDNFNVKHPLMHDWTLWFTKPPSGKVREDLFVRFCLCALPGADRFQGR
jgi:translation initiation factor 4E